jgi:hypothetical protein
MVSGRERPEYWMQDLEMFLDAPASVAFRHGFFRQVATPMWMAYVAYSQRGNSERFSTALEIMEQCRAEDWRLACTSWLHRRRTAWADKMEKSRVAGS